MKSPPRGRISTCSLMPCTFLAADIKPVDGVTPPSPSALHNSTRSDPPAAAALTLSMSPAQISSVIGFMVFVVNTSFLL